MTYKELEKMAEDNGYEIKNDIDYVILTKYKENIIKIYNFKEDIMFSTIKVCFKNDFLMLQASLKYSDTPLEDRYAEKKYYLKHRFVGEYDCDKFLNYILSDDKLILSDEKKLEDYKVKFTQREIDNIKERYNTDLKDFDIIEVENDIR